jgi:lipopolysaccharide/colanic/teichoic acid biosynthesis glycosyltransferase
VFNVASDMTNDEGIVDSGEAAPHPLHVDTRPSVWSWTSLQLATGAIFAVLIPWGVHAWVWQDLLAIEALHQSAIGTSLAFLLGYYGFRRFSRYPGTSLSRSIMPSLIGSYGTVLAVFFFARLDYNRIQFLSSFLLCTFWFFIIYFKLQREKDLRIGVVPAGNVDSLLEIPGVDWVRLGGATSDARYHAVVADLRADMPAEWERFLADCALHGVNVMHVKQVQESLTGKVAIEHLSENTLGTLLPSSVYGRVKRAGDLLFCLLALPLIALILLVAAIAIRLDSRGPILFRQERMGYRGRPFSMLKLRTMRVQADTQDPRAAAITRGKDDRVTRVGRFLRRYRVDELPQFVNILKGEMSWIGPRPEAVPLSAWYEAELPFYRYRHIVRPGITGWAQVRQGHVAEVHEVQSKLHYDFYYIKHFSFWLDLLIVAGTARTVLSGFGAR